MVELADAVERDEDTRRRCVRDAFVVVVARTFEESAVDDPGWRWFHEDRQHWPGDDICRCLQVCRHQLVEPSRLRPFVVVDEAEHIGVPGSGRLHCRIACSGDAAGRLVDIHRHEATVVLVHKEASGASGVVVDDEHDHLARRYRIELVEFFEKPAETLRSQVGERADRCAHAFVSLRRPRPKPSLSSSRSRRHAPRSGTACHS